MRWLLRLVLLRVLGPRAVPLLALLGLVRALRDRRARDVASVDARTGRVRFTDGRIR